LKKRLNMLYKSERGKWIGGLILILLIYSLFYLLFADRYYTYSIPRKIRHLIKFSTTITVYLVGTFHLGQIKSKWMLQLWHFIHVSLLLTITSIGIYDWTIGMVSYKTKEIAASMQEFLISPVLYFAMGLINNKLNQQNRSSEI